MSRRACRAVAAAITAIAVAAVASCDDGSTDASSGTTGSGFGCKLPFVGDPSQPMTFTLLARGAELVSKELGEGDPLPMILPPQGGRVVLVGVRATNLDPCGVELLGSIRDTATQQVRVDQRNTNLLVSADAATAESSPEDISSYANIPTCPNQWASVDIQGTSFEITLVLTDRAGRSATQTLNAVPFCSEPENEAECLCKCQQGYTLGMSCPPPDP